MWTRLASQRDGKEPQKMEICSPDGVERLKDEKLINVMNVFMRKYL